MGIDFKSGEIDKFLFIFQDFNAFHQFFILLFQFFDHCLLFLDSFH